ncbi:uncharacterized protein Dmoj_GI26468 [Drosophila mojavensis]|uniref:Uncharacterized protein n=1 Tax=Drosophila mojavensis TaxID=7230 RepID=A0A0Q9XNC7_DROMO|nr:uncharacterized protein Dmoj_GI26468 [Drosophila mojavensis]
MANAFQMLLIISAFHYNKLFVNVMDTILEMDVGEMKKYEYCVKVVVICYTVHDSPTDSDGDYDNYIKKNGCIKKGLSEEDNTTYWEYVHQWQHEVEEIMLDLNILTISEQYDQGNCIKIDLGLYFHIPKIVVCDRRKMYGDTLTPIITTTATTTTTTTTTISTTTKTTTTTTTTTTEPTTTEIIEHGPQCNESDQKGKWIKEQTELVRRLPTLVSRLPNVEAKLNVLLNRNCCPYPIIRDRVEIINDIVDLLIQLFCVPFTERAKSTGYALLDIENFMTRLGELNLHAPQNNRFNCSCCSDWQVDVKGVIERFRKTLISIVPDYVSIISILNSLSGNQNNLVQNSKISEEHLSAIAKIIDNNINNNKGKCFSNCTKLLRPLMDP